MDQLSIRNMVVRLTCNTKFNLPVLLDLLSPDSEYDPEMYFALIYRSKNPKASYLVNSSGVVVLNGVKDPSKLGDFERHFVQKMKSVGIDCQITDRKISNIVATADLEDKIDLNKLAIKSRNSEYDPETFPGLVMKLSEGKALVFANGKISLVGFKSPESLEKGLRELKRTITEIKNN